MGIKLNIEPAALREYFSAYAAKGWEFVLEVDLSTDAITLTPVGDFTEDLRIVLNEDGTFDAEVEMPLHAKK